MSVKSHISIHQVSKSFGKKKVLDDISFDVQASKIFGLLGPSGAGKTTLVKMIAGIETPSKGRVEVMSCKMPNLDMMGNIGFMAQSDALYSELSGWENLAFFASIYGLSKTRLRKRIDEVLALVDLTEHQKKTVDQYSGGMKRRLSLAASLLHEPEVLILDEPTVGIDPVLRRSIWQELNKLSRNGTTIIVTTHVMDEAEHCDRLGMLRDGQLIATGSPEALKQETSSATLEEAFLHYGGVEA